MPSSRFAITADALGGRIVVDDQEVTDQVGAAEVRIAQHQPTVLTLHLLPGSGEIVGEGVVQVVEQTEKPDSEIICEFLERIDPMLLESDALMHIDASTSPTAAILQMLQRYAAGD